MKLFLGKAPKRKSKPKPNPLERMDDYVKLRALIANGKMKPQEIAGLIIDASDGMKLHLKYPARTATDQLRRFIKELGLEADYHVLKYETDTPGTWAVTVLYEPPAGKRG